MAKKISLGILAITLVFSMTLVGCDDDLGEDTHIHSFSETYSFNTTQHWRE